MGKFGGDQFRCELNNFCFRRELFLPNRNVEPVEENKWLKFGMKMCSLEVSLITSVSFLLLCVCGKHLEICLIFILVCYYEWTSFTQIAVDWFDRSLPSSDLKYVLEWGRMNPFKDLGWGRLCRSCVR